MADLVKTWTKTAARLLVGRKIVAVRYLTEEEQQELSWCGSAVVLVLDSGVEIYPSADDEGNGPGALYTTNQEIPILPVIRT